MSNARRYCIDGDSWILTTMDNLRTLSGLTTHIPQKTGTTLLGIILSISTTRLSYLFTYRS